MKKAGEKISVLSMSQHYLEKELFHLLQHDKLMFEFFQNDVVDGLWYWDLTEPENEWMSPKFWRLFGYDPEFKEHKVSEWQDLIFPEDLAIAQRNLKLHLKNPEIPYDQVVRYRHRNGSIIWVRCKGIAIYSENGEPVRLLGCHQDLTRVMERQQELLGLQIRFDHLSRRYDELQFQTTRSQYLNERLEQQYANDQASDAYGLSGKQVFVEQTRILAATARRLNLQVTLVMANTEKLNGDRTRIAEFKTFVGQSFGKHLAGAALHAFSEECIGAVAIGYTQNELDNLNENIENSLNNAMWLSGKQNIFLQMRLLPVKDEMLDKYLDISYILDQFFK